MTNINPSQKDYKNLSKFKFFTLTNFPFIEADFDAITNYELMCKIVEHLNNVIENEQNVSYNVRELYNAFMELQNEINDEIEKQNARIEEYFDDINIQTFVDNKINEMIESDEFQELLIEALNEINPNIIKFSNKVQLINFDSPFYATGAPFHILQQYVLNSINKALLINAIKETLIEQEGIQFPTFYFINPWDVKVIRYTAEISYHNNIADTLLIVPTFDFNSENIGANQEYTGYAKFNILYTNGEITDLTFNEEYSQHYRQVNIGNTQSFVPTLPYEPATKDYVDLHAGGSDLPVYYWKSERDGTVVGCSQYSGISFDGTDWDTFKEVLNEAHANGDNDFILIMKLSYNTYNELYSVHINDFSDSDSSTTVNLRQFLNSDNYRNLLIYGQNNTGSNYDWIGFTCSIVNGLIDSFRYQTTSPSNNSTFVKAEDIIPTDISNQVSISSDVQAVGVEGIKFMKQGMQYNLHGTITAPNGSSWSGATLEIPAEHAPIEFESGVGYTACYTTCILIKASDNSMQYLYSNYVHVADAVAGGFSFSPIASGITLEAGDAIRFNISYIRKQAN